MQHRGFDPPWSLLVEGIFPLESASVLTPFPKTLSGVSIDRGLVCARMRSFARTQKILTFYPWRVDAGNKNTPTMNHPRRRAVNTSLVGYPPPPKKKATTKNKTKRTPPKQQQQQQQKRQKKKKKTNKKPQTNKHPPPPKTNKQKKNNQQQHGHISKNLIKNGEPVRYSSGIAEEEEEGEVILAVIITH